MKKRLFAMILAGAMAISSVLPAAAAETNGNNSSLYTAVKESVGNAGSTAAEAKVVKFGEQFGRTRAAQDNDWYKFTLTSSGYLRVTGSSNIQWLKFEILDIYGNSVGSTDEKWNNDDIQRAVYDFGFRLNMGEYYMKVSDRLWNRSGGTYSLKLSFESCNETITETGKGINNTFDTASNIPLNRQYKGQLSLNELADYYTFTTSRKTDITVNCSAHSDNPRTCNSLWLSIYNERGDRLYKNSMSSYKNDAGNIEFSRKFENLEQGKYYVLLSNDWICGLYTYTLTVKDNNNSGSSSSNGIALKSVSAKSLTATGSKLIPKLTVIDASGKTIAASNYTVSVDPSTVKNVGTYTVAVKGKKEYSGSVKTSFEVIPKSTTIKSVKASSKAFTVAYKAQKTQTTGYQIEYSTNNSFSNSKKVSVSKNSTTSATIKSLLANQIYYVRVRTYKSVNGKNYYSSWSASKTVKTM